jgi:hypothetical protein
VKKDTTVAQERIYTKTFLRFVGDRNMRMIKAQVLDQWKADRMSKVKPTTFNIEKRSLQAIFEIAKKWGYLQDNPFVHVTTLKVEERRLYMTGDELKRLFEVIDSDIVHARNSHHIESYTGSSGRTWSSCSTQACVERKDYSSGGKMSTCRRE